MSRQLPPLVQRFLDKAAKSRDLSVSLVLHAALVALFGSVVLINVVKEPSDVVSGEDGFVTKAPPVPKRPTEDSVVKPAAPDVTRISSALTTGASEVLPPILTTSSVLDLPATLSSGASAAVAPPASLPAPQLASPDRLTPELRHAIDDFTRDWRGAGGTGTNKPLFQFTAFIGQYQGGNWNSTVRVSQGQIETGSLPNLLYLMSFWSKDKVQTNYRNVRAIRLDSDDLFTEKPPFIFLTGTRDFTLTDREVENLRRYIRLGGCIWGDGSAPGERSRFYLAFKREMLRVVGNVDAAFEPLPANHPIYTAGYFPQVKSVPRGLNFYQLPVYAMKTHGEVSILYTANDYGDMWQIGLDAEGHIDLRRDAKGQAVATNPVLYDARDVYVRNLSPDALKTSYQFGANVVMHLLTRWDSKVRSGSAL